jgi:uncharacterized membrane protein YgaE (UPF0421/DUF939 family)
VRRILAARERSVATILGGVLATVAIILFATLV